MKNLKMKLMGSGVDLSSAQFVRHDINSSNFFNWLVLKFLVKHKHI